MAGPTREQAIALLSAGKNHGDLAVKLSSLKQAKEILLSFDSHIAADLFPYLVELQSSPEVLVRKFLVELVEELGLKAIGQSPVLMPILLAFLRDEAPVVVRQSIVSSMHFFCRCLEEMAQQYHQSGKVERWLQELWMWMMNLKDAIFGIALEPGSIGVKLLAIKFLEMYVLLFTSDADDFETPVREENRQSFNISWVSGGHPILNHDMCTAEGDKGFGYLLNMLQSASTLSGSLIIAVINCL